MRRTFSTTVNDTAVSAWLLIARIAIGAFMLTHGIPKFEKLLAGNVQFADPFGLGPTVSLALTVFAEVFCSILLMLGLATRLVSVPMIVNMLVAVIVAHGGQPFGKKELPLMFLVFYLGFLIMGAGKYSVDNVISGKNKIRY